MTISLQTLFNTPPRHLTAIEPPEVAQILGFGNIDLSRADALYY